MSTQYFSPQTFAFLAQLEQNNTREWFEVHKQDYEDFVRTPALRFIADMSDAMPALSRHFLAQPKKVGGSLMRVQRDTRFSKIKTPYKTNIGIQFRHEVGKDVHAPGYYLHIAPGECFLGVGLWRPEPDALFKIRQAIVEQPEAWVAARDAVDFRRHYTLEGESLANAPRGYAKDHPLLADLKRKDFIGLCRLSEADILSGQLLPLVVERYRAAASCMGFLCKALALPF
ncbi:TIGR02453 family protein [Ferriphaselus sp. R-1]|uniref:DUF2461 domain-containing protein n=1 Tax=Ferriphaselus sp. R-1 TaxID=1485544 RepID=UPI00055277D0|nr:TIGR02453 family protein [Ferriphaselus sp. R-1]